MRGLLAIKNNSMFVKLLLSMTAIALITVVLISSVTYMISADNSVRNSIGYNESVLTQQQELIQKELTTIRNAANSLLMAQSYLYQTIGGKLSVSSLIDLSTLVEEQKKLSPYIDSIYLYYAPLELVLTSRPEIKTSPILSFADRSWLDTLNQDSGSRTVWLTGRPNGFSPDHPATSLLQKMPLIGHVEGAIVINLNLNRLFADYLSHYKSKKGTIMVIGPQGELLYSDAPDGETLLQQMDTEQVTTDSGYYIGDSDQIVTYTTSNMTGWRFVDITERSVLLQGMNRIKIIVWTVAILYITAAVAISYYVSRRLYRPLQSVISYIVNSEESERRDKSGAPSSTDEAGFIRHSFEQMTRNRDILMKEKRKVDELLTGNRTAIKEKYLNDLIQGNGREEPASGPDHAAELLGLKLDFSRFAILTLELEEHDPKKGSEDIFHSHLLQYGLMEELGEDIDGEIFVKDSRHTVILLSLHPDADDTFPIEQARSLKLYFLSRYGISVTIAVSRVHSGEPSVRAAYNETQEALNMKIYIGKGEILPFSILDEWKSEEGSYYYPYELEMKLQQSLLQTDKEECTAVIRAITREVLEQRLGRANIHQLYVQLSGELVKTLVQTGGEVTVVFGESSSYTDALARAETVQDMEECVLTMCSTIIDYHREKRSKMTDVTLQLATEYMDDHFNKNISVDSVAEHVKRSTSYLGRIFKESKGMTVNDYLIQLRIKRAIELLKQTDTSVEEICREIGYANVSYFNKIFKARTGLTPGQFRQQQAAEQRLAQGKGPKTS
ncbi:helix-turn-helix domain-containing protein [Paenibacillus sp. HJL G12]|uniref:Helix-turn-helix domain-containing protein n=1 Tax=Paenibacillus dendrobii TaxID=2691084 RepID=A0A7X3IJ01_9BACL|nr:helix-turn-helix domain-containing protein [Paenibacillus dendrobii]MWV44336.1 helix-turn-helix domain-containing protein [Paenibacillus dendrobii]